MFSNNSRKDIETGVDKLLSLIESRKEISVMQAARELNIRKEVILHWSDAMAEQGIIKIRQTLNECLLTSLDYYEITSKKNSIIKNLVTLTPLNKDSDKEVKEEQIEKKLKLLDAKLKEFKGVKEKHNKMQLEKANLKKEKVALKEKQKEFRKNLSLLLKKSRDTEKKIERAMKIEDSINKKIQMINLKSKVLSVKEKALSKKENHLVRKIAAAKEKEEKLKKSTVDLIADKNEHARNKKAHKLIEKKNKALNEVLYKKKTEFRNQVKLLRMQRDNLFIRGLELQREKSRLIRFAKLLAKEPTEKNKAQVFRIINLEEEKAKEDKKEFINSDFENKAIEG